MRICLLIMCCIIGVISTACAKETDQNQSKAILTFDSRGGQKPRADASPVLEIYADGTMVSRAEKPGGPPVVRHLSKDEQEDLLQKIVYQTGILEITTSSIQNEIKMQNVQLSHFPDAPITFLSIELPEGSTSIAIKGVSALAHLVPEAVSIQKLYFIQKSLFDLVKKINLEAN